MYRQALGVVTDVEYREITHTERKTNWLLLGALGLGALLLLTRGGQKIIVMKG